MNLQFHQKGIAIIALQNTLSRLIIDPIGLHQFAYRTPMRFVWLSGVLQNILTQYVPQGKSHGL